MAGLTNYAEEKALEHFLAGVAYTPASSVFVGLFTTAPDDAGANGVEVSTGGYQRQACTFGAYASRRIASNVALSFPAGADWGSIPAYGIWDASTGGNLLSSGTIVPAQNVTAGQTFPLASGEVVIELTVLGPSLAEKILNLLFKNTAAAGLAGSLYAHLTTTAPNNDGTGGTYLSASGYTPQAVSFAQFVNGRCNLAADAVFSNSIPAAWGTLPAWVLRDNVSPSSGNFLAVGELSPLPTLGIGAPAVLVANSSFVGLD
jgi:hypothetical protein